MNKKLFFPSLLFLSLPGIALYFHSIHGARAATVAREKTLALYDATSGAIPNEKLMDFTDFPPGAASLAYSDGATTLDTTASGSDTYAGWVSGRAITSGFPTLDRTAGIQVNFTLQLESETHARASRAGFSVIILDQDARGIELSFWENEVWVQNDDVTGGLFTHGEGVALPTTTGWIDYQVTIAGDMYTLTANSQPILSGPVRDYSSFDGFPNPYRTPNFVFLGDDTTAAQARVRLRFVSVTGTASVLPTDTAISTNLPQATASFTSLPDATLVPSLASTPTNRMIKICPPGWLLLPLTAAGLMILQKTRR